MSTLHGGPAAPIAPRSLWRALALGAAALVAWVALAAACGGGAEPPAPTQATPAAKAAATRTPSPAPSGPYPVTVTDMLARQVTITSRPQRIVAISPTAVELIYAVGGTVVGRSATAVFPAEAQAAPDVGSAYQPNTEAILALRPDLVVADSVIHAQPQLQSAITKLTVPVVFAGAGSYEQVLTAVNLLGKVLDRQERAGATVRDIEAALAQAKTALGTRKVSAVVLIADRDQTLYAAKATSYAGDILARVGLTNPAASEPDSGPFPGYTAVAPEKLLRYNPDFVLTVTPAPAPAPRLSTLVPQIPPFRGLAAVQANRVIELDLAVFLQAPGPRVAEALRALAKLVDAS